MAEDFYSFERALRELQMREEELKKLVSAGEIRAFRDGEQMKLRREDIERMRSRRTSAGGEVVDLGEEVPLASEEEPGMATAQISEEDTLLADEDAPVEVEVAEVAEAAPVAAPPPRVRPRAALAARAVEVEPAGEGMGVRFCLVATTVLLVLAGFVAYGASNDVASGIGGGIANVVKGMME